MCSRRKSGFSKQEEAQQAAPLSFYASARVFILPHPPARCRPCGRRGGRIR
ncbi:MAG: hypothetical protein AB1405_09745 [Bdellovibrionota bacterium]